MRVKIAAMRYSCLPLALIAALLAPAEGVPVVKPSSVQAGPRRPFPQHVTYAAGTIRPNRRAQARQDDDVRAYYEVWKAKYLLPAGKSADGSALFRVSFGATNPGRTVSEGQGYGMLIVALMAGHDPDARNLFDGLWKFSRTYPSRRDSRLMSWQVPVSSGNYSAFDGDTYIAYALLKADAQWGSSGDRDYREAAKTVIAGILASTIGPESRLPMLGDWVKADGETYNQYTPRSSDLIPDHFRAFGVATRDPVWARVIAETQSVISQMQKKYSPGTGLLPDFIVPVSAADHTPRPAPPSFLEGVNDGNYGYNAGRVPWHLGTDALLSGDSVALAQTRKIAQWAIVAAKAKPSQIRGGYALDGSPLPDSDYFSIFFAAPLGVAAMTEPSQQAWLNDLYDSVFAKHQGYYEDSVTLLSLLMMTGNTWKPESSPTAKSAGR
ncbi:MAG TPA: glycosyl hydrolase family 8 [Thermoanaerobaculia bacterium]|nr:glycosyl hydrolase family 8 [Thermoanaerobaculia bacterium]